MFGDTRFAKYGRSIPSIDHPPEVSGYKPPPRSMRGYRHQPQDTLMKYSNVRPGRTHIIDLTNQDLINAALDFARANNPDLDIPMLPASKVTFHLDIANKWSAEITWKTEE